MVSKLYHSSPYHCLQMSPLLRFGGIFVLLALIVGLGEAITLGYSQEGAQSYNGSCSPSDTLLPCSNGLKGCFSYAGNGLKCCRCVESICYGCYRFSYCKNWGSPKGCDFGVPTVGVIILAAGVPTLIITIIVVALLCALKPKCCCCWADHSVPAAYLHRPAYVSNPTPLKDNTEVEMAEGFTPIYYPSPGISNPAPVYPSPEIQAYQPPTYYPANTAAEYSQPYSPYNDSSAGAGM